MGRRLGSSEEVWKRCNTQVHGSNARNLSVQLSSSQTSKMLCLSYYLLCFSSTKLRTRRQNRFCPEEMGEGDGKTMYTHVSKCKNYKIKNTVKTISFFLNQECSRFKVCTEGQLHRYGK
jgi:hypothetical protein